MPSNSSRQSTLFRREKLNKIEQLKAAKDGLDVGKELESFASMGWEQMESRPGNAAQMVWDVLAAKNSWKVYVEAPNTKRYS